MLDKDIWRLAGQDISDHAAANAGDDAYEDQQENAVVI